MMKQINWFERTFDFSYEQNIFPSLRERLEGTPILLKNKVATIPAKNLTIRRENTWSIQENIGHLIDLEPLWQGRLDDILNGEEKLRAVDLKNIKTNLARHNDKNIAHLMKDFLSIRSITMSKLNALTEEEVYKTALHPRLLTPMRTMDLFLFVAEHDDHHLARITKINNLLLANTSR